MNIASGDELDILHNYWLRPRHCQVFEKQKAAVKSGQAAVISGQDRIGNVKTLLTNLPGRFVNNVCTLLKIWVELFFLDSITEIIIESRCCYSTAGMHKVLSHTWLIASFLLYEPGALHVLFVHCQKLNPNTIFNS